VMEFYFRCLGELPQSWRREFIVELVDRARGDQRLLSVIGAGPFEDYIDQFDVEDVEWLERNADLNASFRTAMKNMYLSFGLPGDLRRRINRAAGHPLDRYWTADRLTAPYLPIRVLDSRHVIGQYAARGADEGVGPREAPEGGSVDVTVETLRRLVDAFNAHDLDAVMSFFSDDCVLEMPRGQEPWGRRMQGREQVREGLASRFAGIPDVHYGDDRHWVCGNRGCSEWLVTGTTIQGERIAVRGCDLFEFEGGRIVRKDSYWKIIDR
jgi:ketosteroid isomerase-like protein